MDYKSAILKGIEEFKAIANDPKYQVCWDVLAKQIKKETETWKLHYYHRCFVETMAEAKGEPIPEFTIKLSDGSIRTFKSTGEYLDFIHANNK